MTVEEAGRYVERWLVDANCDDISLDKTIDGCEMSFKKSLTAYRCWMLYDANIHYDKWLGELRKRAKPYTWYDNSEMKAFVKKLIADYKKKK